MGLLGYIVGGALQGAGQGIAQEAVMRRNAALEAMRQQYQTQRDDRAAELRAAERKEERGWKVEDQKTDYTNKAGLLALGGQVQGQRDAQQHGYKMAEITQTQVGQKELATLQSRLQAANTAAEIKLRDSLESGDISNVVRGEDGQYYGVTKSGLIATGVTAAPTAAETGETGGGRLTESEQSAAYEDDRRAWRDGGKKGPEPKKSDYIGMTRQAYSTRGGGAPAARQAPQSSPIKTQPNGQMNDRDLALSQLATSYANATPERYPGLFRNGKKLPFAEARRLVEERYR